MQNFQILFEIGVLDKMKHFGQVKSQVFFTIYCPKPFFSEVIFFVANKKALINIKVKYRSCIQNGLKGKVYEYKIIF